MMFKRLFLVLGSFFLPSAIYAAEYSENLVILANDDIEDVEASVSDDEVDNLVLFLENEGVISSDDEKAAIEAERSKDPYKDLIVALDQHQVNPMDKNIIMGMVIKDTATNLLAGLMMFYVNISNFFLHPLIILFMAIIGVLLIITIVLGVLKYKKEDFAGVKKYSAYAGIEIILATYLAALIYEDFLGFTIYKKYMMGVLFVALSIVVGFILGNIFSKFYFEDKILP